MRAARIDVGEELFPLRPEPVGELGVVRDLLPLASVVLGRRQIRIPYRHGRLNAMLDAAAEQARNCRAVSAVHLELDQLAAVDSDCPGGVDLSDHVIFQLEDRVGSVIGGGGVLAALFVPSLWDMGDGLGGYRLHLAEQILEHIVPVGEHVEDHAPAILGPVVPAGTLTGQEITLEDPVPELPTNGENASEE